ncbi:hypothetical protein PoB_001638600 [Plakobranchus ocellatus]|uniref:Uncharacterized protein n=1 Tax=Plakobranchus ocellatus TaxID=259542 RepID=A0AAV3Z201_9GAST|nr:hypothetical protein PoB_001638600 [Plakobranchus ocellatus]
MAQEITMQHRPMKKVSVLSMAHDLSAKYNVPTSRAPLTVPTITFESALSPTPLTPQKPACISDGWAGRKKRAPSL